MKLNLKLSIGSCLYEAQHLNLLKYTDLNINCYLLKYDLLKKNKLDFFKTSFALNINNID